MGSRRCRRLGGETILDSLEKWAWEERLSIVRLRVRLNTISRPADMRQGIMGLPGEEGREEGCHRYRMVHHQEDRDSLIRARTCTVLRLVARLLLLSHHTPEDLLHLLLIRLTLVDRLAADRAIPVCLALGTEDLRAAGSLRRIHMVRLEGRHRWVGSDSRRLSLCTMRGRGEDQVRVCLMRIRITNNTSTRIISSTHTTILIEILTECSQA